jgi:hypothetical protein
MASTARLGGNIEAVKPAPPIKLESKDAKV